MAGYTDGVAKNMADESQQGKLFITEAGTDFQACADAYSLDIGDMVAGATIESDDETIYISDDGKTYEVVQDLVTFINENSQGGLIYLSDEQGNFLGARLGVCGKHMGSVSVWLDTYKGVLEQGGNEYSITQEDTDELNQVLKSMFEEPRY